MRIARPADTKIIHSQHPNGNINFPANEPSTNGKRIILIAVRAH